MVGYSNNMTNLVNKIEGRLGLKHITLPKEYNKSTWAPDIIVPDTLTTFSRFYQRKIKYHVDESTPMKNGWYYLDENVLGTDVEVLGILDIDFQSLTHRVATQGYGAYDVFSMADTYDPATMALSQAAANYGSLFDSGIYLETEEPNKFKLESTINQNLSTLFKEFDIYILIKHSANLVTISPTMMEAFDKLAQADVSLYLYNALKYYDGLETAYVQLDMKLDDLRSEADKRENIVEELDEYHTSASNPSQPMILTV